MTPLVASRAASSKPRLNSESCPVLLSVPSGKMHTTSPASSSRATVLIASRLPPREIGTTPKKSRNQRRYQRS